MQEAPKVVPLSEEEVYNAYNKDFVKAIKTIEAAQSASWRSAELPFPLSFFRKFFWIFFLIYFLIRPEKAKETRRRAWKNPSLKVIRTAWNTTENSPLYGLSVRLAPKLAVTDTFKVGDTPVLLFSAVPLSSDEAKRGCLIHIHGGGMVAISSRSQWTFLCSLAQKLKIPVLSIEYKLAPEYKHPVAINECFEVYKWVLEKGHEMGISNKKILVMGDSAGGFLNAALILKTIIEDIRVPEYSFLNFPKLLMNSSASVLIYPALMRDPSYPLPSRIKFANDIILPRVIRETIGPLYLNPTDNVKDPLVSPLYASDEQLSKWPNSLIIVGSQDPLFDDSQIFQERLKALSRPVQYVVYSGVSHGFYPFEKIVLEAANANLLTAEWIQKSLAD